MAAVTPDATVTNNQQTAAQSVTTPALTTTATNELLLAFVNADAVSQPNTTVTSVTGGGLTWVLVNRTNVQSGTSEIWRAFAPAILKGATVTANLSQNVVASITVQSYTGVATSGTNGSGAIGAVASGHAATGAPTATLVTTQSNSIVVGTGNDYDQAIARTPLPSQSLIKQDLTSTGDTYWVQRVNASLPTKGTRITLADSAPTTDQYNLSICEILPAASQLTLSANNLAFGSVVDGSSKSLSVTVTASGTSPVTLNSATISGTGFTLGTTSLPKTLAAGQTLTLPVTFDPKTAGAVTGKITITSNAASGATSTVALTGTGVAATSQLTLSASSLAFGNVTDATSKALSVVLTASGTEAVTVSSATISGTGFTLGTTGLPKTLAAGQTVTLPVTFAPKTAGAVTGKITITSNAASGATSTVALTGTGVAATSQLTLSATTLAFGNVTDATSKALSVVLTASGGEAVNVSSASITGTGFTLGSTGLPITLSGGQSVTIPVTFKPTVAGAVTGKVTITSNATSGSVSTIALTGTGVAATTTSQLTLSTSTLAFGSVTTATSKSLTLTLTSSGTGPVTINSAAIAGTGFSITSGGGFPLTLAAKAAETITVSFDPTAVGADAGTLTINSTSTTASSAVVALSGTGTSAPYSVDLSWNAPTTSSDPVAGYHVYRSSGSSAMVETPSTLVTTTSYVDSTVVNGTTYTYEVKSVDASGVESAASNTFIVTIPAS